MATKTTGWRTTHSASIVSQDNTSAKIRVTAYWQNDGWNYDINSVSAWVYCNGSEQKVKDNGSLYAPDNHGSYSQGSYDFTVSKGTSAKSISCYAKITTNSSYVSGTKSSSATSVSVAAKPSYTVSYNANGGSGAPTSQTKWYGTNLTLSSTKPTRTGYTFAGWATSTSGSVAYQPGATYSANAGVTLYAKWTANTYTVSYNANGGSGAPSNQTKTYGVNLTLSSTKPTRTNYNFLGWSTSSNGGVVYNSGATYTNNSAVTLYAVWELAYVKPRINNFTAQRCMANGSISETGTYIKISFNWATDYEVEAIWLDWSTKPYFNANEYANYQVIASGTSGSVTQVIGNGDINIETTYYTRSYVKDAGGSSHSIIKPIGTVTYPIDVRRYGFGVAIGKVAEEDHLFDVGLKTRLAGGLDGDINWKEDGYGDKFAISPSFAGSGDLNLLKIQGAVGDANTDPSLYDLMTISALSGNVWIKGYVDATNLIIFRGTASDLNSIKDTTGIYLYDNNTSNRPSNFADWGSVINYKCASWCYQIAVGNYLVSGYNKILAIRTYVNDAWIDWHFVG